jgi:hypothetical protein
MGFSVASRALMNLEETNMNTKHMLYHGVQCRLQSSHESGRNQYEYKSYDISWGSVSTPEPSWIWKKPIWIQSICYDMGFNVASRALMNVEETNMNTKDML